MTVLAPSPSPVPIGIPYGLVSLWDMINFSVADLVRLMDKLDEFQGHAQAVPVVHTNTQYAFEPIAQIRVQLIEPLEKICAANRFDRAYDRISRMMLQIRGQTLTPKTAAAELHTLREALIDDLRWHHFCHYKPEKDKFIQEAHRNWEKTRKAFPVAAKEVDAALDCYAVGQPTAAVFHFVRAAELGLRAVARERRVKLPKNRKIEYAQWGDVIKELEKEIKSLHNMRAGPRRDAALAFYTGAVSHLQHIKDRFRNDVMHTRVNFDDGDALSAMNHTCTLMEMLSARLDESGSKKINWTVK